MDVAFVRHVREPAEEQQVAMPTSLDEIGQLSDGELQLLMQKCEAALGIESPSAAITADVENAIRQRLRPADVTANP